jgi:hypothetical protein
MPENPGDFALIVGVKHYPDFRPVEGALEDAEDFEKWVLDTEKGGGVTSAHCRKVLSTPNPIRPIQDDVDDALDALITQLNGAKARRFYLYFAGHGLGRKQFGADLCLARWSDKRRNLALDSEEYATMIAESGKFTEVVVFLDCCRVRKVNTRGLPSTLGWARPDEGTGKTRIYLGFATEFQDRAFEAETADADGKQIRGHFTRALMEGLRGGAASDGGGVTAEALKKYVELETPRIAQKAGHQQTPNVINGLPAGVVFGSAGPVVEARIVFKAGRTGEVVLEGPEGEEIRRGDASTGPWNVKLRSAMYALLAPATLDEKTFRIRPAAGVTDVEF